LTTESLKRLPTELVNTGTMKPQVAVQWITDATALEENFPRTPVVPGRQPEDLLTVVTVLEVPAVVVALLIVTPKIPSLKKC
jgi:hypothetical protein